MAEMTPRQRKAWEARMLNDERRMVTFFRSDRNILTEPDGSFLMSAFLDGWQAATRADRKEREK